MKGEEDCQWVNMMIDEIGYALTKVDETIQKSIMLWRELTKDMFDDQRTKELTGQPSNVVSGEEHSWEVKSVAEVKETPIQHWSLCLDEVNEELIQHWDICASKVKEQGDDHYDGNDDDYDYFEEEEEEEETTASESSENMWEINLGAAAMISSEDDRCSSLRWKSDYELLKDVSTSSKEDDESWDGDYDDKEEDKISKLCRDVWNDDLATEMELIRLHYDHNEEDNGSNLSGGYGYQPTRYGYEPSKYGTRFPEEDYAELEQEMFFAKLEEELLLSHDDEDDLSDKLQGFVDVGKENIANGSEVEPLLPECDWVYVDGLGL